MRWTEITEQAVNPAVVLDQLIPNAIDHNNKVAVFQRQGRHADSASEVWVHINEKGHLTLEDGQDVIKFKSAKDLEDYLMKRGLTTCIGTTDRPIDS